MLKFAQSILTKCGSRECVLARHINRENAPITFLAIQVENFQNACELTANSFIFRWIVKMCPVHFLSALRLNSTGNSYVLWHINCENAPRTFFVKLASGEITKCVWIHSKHLHVWMQKSWRCALFVNLARQNEPELYSKQLHLNRESSPRTLFVNLPRWKLPKYVWTSEQTSLFLDAEVVKMCLALFFQKLQVENFHNASELHSKQLRLWTHK